MKKNSKIKEYIKKFKELWSIPRYRALIKLSLYGIMFLFIIIMSNLYKEMDSNTDVSDNEKSYAEILKDTNLENIDILYTIQSDNKVYSIEGNINNNILSGYLENNGTIKKIKIENNTIYNIINNTEVIDDELNSFLIIDFLLPKNIIDLVNNEAAYIEKSETQTTYTYEIINNNINYEIKLISDLQKFTDIVIKSDNIEYNLNINF